jgi:hypothetical protein
VVDERQPLDGEDRGDILIVDREQIVAVRLLSAEGEIRRTATDHGVRAVETADDELLVNLMSASDIRHSADLGGHPNPAFNRHLKSHN